MKVASRLPEIPRRVEFATNPLRGRTRVVLKVDDQVVYDGDDLDLALALRAGAVSRMER